MTEMGKLTNEELRNLGMTEDGTHTGFKTNQGYSINNSEYTAINKYTFNNYIFMDGNYDEDLSTPNRPAVMNWLATLANVTEGNYKFKLSQNDMYTIISDATSPWWWGERSVYRKNGNDYIICPLSFQRNLQCRLHAAFSPTFPLLSIPKGSHISK